MRRRRRVGFCLGGVGENRRSLPSIIHPITNKSPLLSARRFLRTNRRSSTTLQMEPNASLGALVFLINCRLFFSHEPTWHLKVSQLMVFPQEIKKLLYFNQTIYLPYPLYTIHCSELWSFRLYISALFLLSWRFHSSFFLFARTVEKQQFYSLLNGLLQTGQIACNSLQAHYCCVVVSAT